MLRLQLFVFFLCIGPFIIFQVNANYSGSSAEKAALERPFEFKCEYNGADGDGQFSEWFKGNDTIAREKSGHYHIENHKTYSILRIKHLKKDDVEIKQWQVKTTKESNAKQTGCQFNQIKVIPSPQGITANNPTEIVAKEDKSIRRDDGKSIVIECMIEPKPGDQSTLEVQWNYSADGINFSNLPNGTIEKLNELHIDELKRIHNGYYRCTYNGFSFQFLLRVKNRLAAFWPFIGIVSVVFILIVVITIFEKRQKSNKKTPDDDEQDQANDPLVKPTTSVQDNDSKTRTINT